jgi:ElaB/YqjD/DUF883 family membrane-anchored ribosome-binding protein
MNQQQLNDILLELHRRANESLHDFHHRAKEILHELHHRANESLHDLIRRTNESLPELRRRANESLPELRRLANESLPELHRLANESLPELRRRANESLPEFRRRANESLPELIHRTSLYRATLIQNFSMHRKQALIVLRDKDQREVFLRQIKEQKHIRLWRTHILLPFILVFSIWNVLGFALHSNNNEVGSSGGAPASGRRISATEAQAAIDKAVIDVLSIGSLLKQEFQDAQVRTFGQHQSIRSFYRITERNDTDSKCFTSLTTDQLDFIIDFCANTKDESYISGTLRKRLFQPKKHSGWMCAQKRPLDGLHQVLTQYKNNVTTVPDYIFIIDDDTYLNMNALTTDLLHYYPVDQPFAVAGCNFNFLKTSGITFPYGGFGSYLTKAAIQRLIQPIYCDGRDEHSTLACWRLNINAIGEKQFFTDGMSVADLMQAYAAKLPFTDVESWTDTGYCFHSDHALAYFINFYHIPVPAGKLAEYGFPKDKMRRRHSYIALAGGNGTECQNEKENCSFKNRICHYITPTHMDQLYAQQQEQAKS